MFRWYMPVFRQMIEWSILNTGVVLRERPNGKKLWTGLNLKMALATDLAFLGKTVALPSTQLSPVLNASQDSISTDEDDRYSLKKIRLQRNILHVPVERTNRLACRVHKQRKVTRFFCDTCKKPMCLGICWKRYHSKVNYLFDDMNCKGKLIENKTVD